MCSDRRLFEKLTLGNFGDVVIANGEKVEITGKGSINICIGTKNHSLEVELQNVFLVPGMESNLISVRKITEKGFSVNFSGRKCQIVGSFGTYWIGEHKDGLFWLVQPDLYFRQLIMNLCAFMNGMNDWLIET